MSQAKKHTELIRSLIDRVQAYSPEDMRLVLQYIDELEAAIATVEADGWPWDGEYVFLKRK